MAQMERINRGIKKKKKEKKEDDHNKGFTRCEVNTYELDNCHTI